MVEDQADEYLDHEARLRKLEKAVESLTNAGDISVLLAQVNDISIGEV